MAAMTPEQTLAHLRAARSHSPRAHAMILLAIRHGMRASEVTGLRLDQLSLREG
jgi:type 1 fimbriae regulatory protein FimB